MVTAHVGATQLSVIEGDITRCDVDVIVNAANEHLSHGGGVAAAISRAGGPKIQEESSAWVERNGPLGYGRAAVTTAGDLSAGHVVHVVGPRYRNAADDERHLRAAVSAALAAAAELGAARVALPAISSGIFGYPTDEATALIVDEAATWLQAHDSALSDVQLVAYDPVTAEAFARALADLVD